MEEPEGEPGEDYSDLRRSVRSPDGQTFEVIVYPGYGGSGSVFLRAEPDAPKVAHILARLVNRGLRRLPQRSRSFSFPVVGVLMHTRQGDVRQVRDEPASDRVEAARIAEELASSIADGRFVPYEESGI